MSLVHEQHLFLQDVTRLLTLAWSHGFEVTGGELYRTKNSRKSTSNLDAQRQWPVTI